MKRMNEKTMLWGQTSFNPDEVLEEDTRDEFEKATDFASKYFKVCESCYNGAKKHMREDAARTHKRAMDYQKYFNEYCEMNGFPYHDPGELRTMEGPEIYADMRKYIMGKMDPITESKKSTKQPRMREDVYSSIGGVKTKRNSMYEHYFHEWCEQNGFDYESPDDVLHDEGYETYKDMEHYITMKIHEFKSNWG